MEKMDNDEKTKTKRMSRVRTCAVLGDHARSEIYFRQLLKSGRFDLDCEYK